MQMVVRRTHTAGNVAPALVVLKSQINRAYPNRDHASDGVWPSAAHTRANPRSDHEAGNALDVDNDLAAGVDVQVIARAIAASADRRVNYIIHAGRIWTHADGWHIYRGSNRHDTHMHLSVHESIRGSAAPWVISKPLVNTVRCNQTHGMHLLPSWVSPTIGKFTTGKRYRVTKGAVGKWRKLLDDGGKQRWGYGPYFD